MNLAPEIRNYFVGQKVHIESLKGGYVRFIPKPGEDDDEAWPGLAPEEHAAVKSRLLRLGVGRKLWASMSPDEHGLVTRACEAIEGVEDAIQTALGVRAWDLDRALEQKARDQVLKPFVEWAAENSAKRQSFDRASDRRMTHWLARSALPHVGRLLRDAKREARTTANAMFADAGWQERTANAVNEALRGFLLPGKCSPGVLVKLRNLAPLEAATELLSSCTGLSEDDLTRRTIPE